MTRLGAHAAGSASDALAEQEMTLRGYRLERIIQMEPGLLTVHQASVASSGERVLVEVFPVPSDAQLRRELGRAINQRVASRHPCVVAARVAFEHQGNLYLVTEGSSAPTLADRREGGPLAPSTALRLLLGVAKALDEVEGRAEWLLSPAGILTQGFGGSRAALTDLGIAISLRESIRPWAHPHAHYASPEMSRGEEVDERSSVYSLGCILFECLTGAPPYEGDWLNLMYAHASHPVPAVSERCPELGGRIDSVVARAMAKRREERFPSAGELMRAARAALDPKPAATGAAAAERPVAVAAGPTRTQSPRRERPDESIHPQHGFTTKPRERTRPSRRAGIALVGCLLAAVAVVGGYLAGRAGSPAPEPAERATAGPLSLQLPSGWARRRAERVLPGIDLSSVVAGGPKGSEAVGVIAGRTVATGEDLLPRGLTTPRRHVVEPVRLGAFDAYRHRRLRAVGSSHAVTAYSIPTPDGAVVITCHAGPKVARGFLPACERVASTLELRGLRTVPLSTLSAERRHLAQILAELRRNRSSGRRRLLAARTTARQAREAGALRVAYGVAADSLRRMDLSAEPIGRARLLAAVEEIERAYRRLARAAALRSRLRYQAARSSVTRTEDLLARLLARRSQRPRR